MRKVIQVFVVLVLICMFSSGACDPARKHTPYSIVNQSSSDIVFSYYYVEDTSDTKEYLLQSLLRDIEIFTTTGPYYEVLKPNSSFEVKSFGTREELLADASRSIIFVWVQETQNLEALHYLSSVTLDDVDFFFLGTANDLAERNWEIMYKGKSNE